MGGPKPRWQLCLRRVVLALAVASQQHLNSMERVVAPKVARQRWSAAAPTQAIPMERLAQMVVELVGLQRLSLETLPIPIERVEQMVQVMIM